MTCANPSEDSTEAVGALLVAMASALSLFPQSQRQAFLGQLSKGIESLIEAEEGLTLEDVRRIRKLHSLFLGLVR